MTLNAGHRAQVDVSVIIPTYNRAALVVEAIESVLRQTRPPREIIVVDDGSTDDTPRALASFGDRIIAIRQENQGVGGARNRALMMAGGRYVAFLDSDDLWIDFKLEWQVALMEEFPRLGFLFSDFLITGEGGKVVPRGLQTWYRHPLRWEGVMEGIEVTSVRQPSKHDPVHLYSGRIYRALLAEPYVLPSCAIVRASCLTPDVRFAENDPNCSDWEFFARLARTCVAGYMEVDTTINRGGDDRPRLTHTSQAMKAQQHLRMINAVWKSDAEFLALHGGEVAAVEADQCLVLAQAQVLDANRMAARAALKRWLRLGRWSCWPKAFAVAACAVVPGTGAFLRVARNVMARAAVVKRASSTEPGAKAVSEQ